MRGGRIAECPRLQQNGSSDDVSFSCKILGSSMPFIDPAPSEQTLKLHRAGRNVSGSVRQTTFPCRTLLHEPATCTTRFLRMLASYL